MDMSHCVHHFLTLISKENRVVSSVAPQIHNGLSKIVLEYSCSHRKLHLVLNRAWWICPRRLPAKKKLVGLIVLLLR